MINKFIVLLIFITLFLSCGKENPPPTKSPIQPIEKQVYQWFQNQALPNGLLESIEDGNVVSLYDNALASLVFMEYGDYEKAEKIFDFFNSLFTPIFNFLKNIIKPFQVGFGLFVDMTQVVLLIIFLLLLNAF